MSTSDQDNLPPLKRRQSYISLSDLKAELLPTPNEADDTNLNSPTSKIRRSNARIIEPLSPIPSDHPEEHPVNNKKRTWLEYIERCAKCFQSKIQR